MNKSESQQKNFSRERRRVRIRARVAGTAERPRLSVFRSAKHVSAQLIDDAAGKTVVSVRDTDLKKTDLKAVEGMQAKVAAAYAVGLTLAEKAKKAGVTKVVFDRGGFAFHGRIKALADGARVGGLEF
jgi:large subunit ribosomal protein L18